MKSIDALKRDAADTLRVAREHRERRQAKQPVMDAYDHLAIASARDCIDCGESIAPRDIAQGFTTCAGCAEIRRDVR